MKSSTADVLIGIGVLLVVAGLLTKTGALGWFGRLPGDLRIEREGLRVYVPWVSMLVVSAVLGLLVRLVSHFLRGR